tara:strand:- start:345 stop:1058 length:714 start_codon:yes stop_codon:yes gene_type:complete
MYNIILTGEEIDFNFSELKSMGADIYHYPMISTSKVINSINPNNFEYIIFTSKNGVKYFMNNLTAKIDDSLGFICIGRKTADKLAKYNFQADYILKRNYSRFMCEDIRALDLKTESKMLLAQGNLAKKDLFDCLSKFINIEQGIFYETSLIDQVNHEIKNLLEHENTFTVFTSPSTFESFIDKYNPNDKIISIGNTTTEYIEGRGYKPLVTAKMQSYEGISNSIINFLNKNLNYEIS